MTVHAKQALVLFAHGARDPRWAEPLVRLQQLIVQRMDHPTAPDAPEIIVRQAFLELMSPTLAELIPELIAQQVQSVTIVPIFLGQGGHVRRDLPELIEQLSTQFTQVTFKLAQAIGESEQVLNAIADVCLVQIDCRR